MVSRAANIWAVIGKPHRRLQTASAAAGDTISRPISAIVFRLIRPIFCTRLRSAFYRGCLQVRLPGDGLLDLGDAAGQRVRIAIAEPYWCVKIALNPALCVGEAYMNGGLVLEEGELSDFVELIGRNAKLHYGRRATALSRWWRDLRLQANARGASRRNVAHHYDLSADFYRRFLDADLQYSCAYFAPGVTDLDDAQAAKKRLLAAKLLLKPGHRVLDIGCGWGGLALTLAERAQVTVDGVTLSGEQLAIALQRARARGLSASVRFSLTDYRDVAGPYDRIVSVGMFEHVGRPNFRAYFEQVARLLNDDGVAVIHTIGRPDGPDVTQPWIAKYIFPGGYIPALSEMIIAIEEAGLIVTDVEILRLHYAKTLRAWRDRFSAERSAIADLYDERFCRMWEFYLCISESAFTHYGHSVFQIQLAKRIDAVPTTRGYLAEAEGALGPPS